MAKRSRWSTMKKDKVSFEKLRQQFTVYNKTAGKSPRTVDWYEQKLELFERYLGPDACLGDVTIPNVRGYIAELQERTQRNPHNPHTRMDGPLSSSYINGIVRGLRAFSTWLNEDGYTETNILKPMKPPKVTQKVKEVLLASPTLIAFLTRAVGAGGGIDCGVVGALLVEGECGSVARNSKGGGVSAR